MATIDSSIALGVKPIQLQDPINRMAAMQGIETGMQTNQLNALKMQETERGLQEEQEVRNYLSGADLTKPETRAGLARFGKTGLALGKQLAEADTARLTQENLRLTGAEAKKKLVTGMFRDLSRSATDAQLQAHFEDFESSGLFNPQEILSAKNRRDMLLSMSLPDRQAYLASQGATASDLKPTIKDTDIGGSVITRALDPYKGTPTQISTVAKTATPGELLTNARSVTARNDGERRDIVANTLTAADGTVTQYNKFGEKIGNLGVVGKPSATFEKTAAQQKQMIKDINYLIPELERITADKGLLDQSTGSGIGRAYDVTAGFFGEATPGAIAIGKLKPIADLALKLVPRFEGPQSNADTTSYKEAAGQLADPTLPVAIRKAAGKELIRLYTARKGQFVTSDMAAEGASAGGGTVDFNTLK